MCVLGVDPGTIDLGYGVVDGEEEMHMVDCGVINLSARLPMEERLRALYDELSRIIDRHRPSEVAIDEPFIGHNVKSAFAIGKAQAIAIGYALLRQLHFGQAQIINEEVLRLWCQMVYCRFHRQPRCPDYPLSIYYLWR